MVGIVHTIEFQKRGLPHMHLLVFLHPNHKIHDADQADTVVSAQIPDKNLHPKLYETVTKCMMHGPCGPEHPRAPCMVDGKCSKRFPREFCSETHFGDDGYPKYARPNNGRTYKNSRGHIFDNRNVVPYNPYLSAKYDCHINVEVCSSVKAVKYIHKYVYKGPDQATVEVSQLDEIKQFIDARYIGPVEGCWRIMEFPMHLELPSVYRLPVHLEGQHMVYFNADDTPEDVLDRASSQKTQLTAWLKANQTHVEAHNHTYQEFPEYFVYKQNQKAWSPRQQRFAIGRMFFVHPSGGERFYLRLLLTVVKGAKEWKDIRTFNGIEYPTYKAACTARGMLEDDGEWNQCLTEAGEMQIGIQLRNLFATILFNCHPVNPDTLWEDHKAKICDDLQAKLTILGYVDPSDDQVYDYGLYLINKILMQSGRQLNNFPPMPLPQGEWELFEGNFLLQEQLDYDVEELAVQVEERKASFNVEQRQVFDAVRSSVIGMEGKIFFLHSAGGGGKTYVCNTIAMAVRVQRKVALCVASSGIASLLLDGGRTAHSRFKIPIPAHENSTCNITKGGDLHGVLQQTGIIIWDEAPMQHKFAIEAVDRTLRDILDKDVPFGGITLLFGGDFRQTLPVVSKGSREQIIQASLRRSRLWGSIKVHHLNKNMRLDQTPESEAFAAWLLDVGAGKDLPPNRTITLPAAMKVPNNDVKGLVDTIYPHIADGDKPDEYFFNRTILCCRNDAVDKLNKEILNIFPGEETVLHSVDKVTEGEEHYPTEFLNTINVSGLPLAHLALKPGCPLMLLRNLDTANGLCNGTRLILLNIKPRVLECRILGGKFAGNTVLIPRISIEPSNEDLPIPLSRQQFPVRLAFAMTINKSQGQSVKHVGLDLRIPVFSHGQLYVALSRCTSGDRIKVLFPNGSDTTTTINIVYPEVLQDIIPLPW